MDVVFKGTRRWDFVPRTGTPDKIGGSAKDILRTIAPYIARGASKFLLNTAGSFADGADLGDAAKGAILPALMGAFRRDKTEQGGKGRARKRHLVRSDDDHGPRRKRAKKRSKKRSKRVMRDGMFGEGIKAARKKRKAPKKTRKAKRGKRRAPTVNF